MKATLFTIAVLSALLQSSSAAILAAWNFNSVIPDSAPGTGTLLPSTGSGTASIVGQITSSFAAGDTPDDPAPTADDSGWQTDGYPSLTGTNKSAGVRFDVNTLGYKDIVVSWYHRNSNTASRYWRLQYTVDGTTFVDSDVIAIYAGGVFTNKVVDLSSIAGATNNASFGVRIVSEWEKTATGSGTNAFVATTNFSNYTTSGTARFDLVSISGNPIPGANTPPTISSVGNQTIRVNQSSAALPINVSDAEDSASSLTMSAVSSDQNVISEANIVFGGAGNNRTVTLSAGGQTGTTTVTLWVTDTGARSNSTFFTATVLPPNTPPTISAIARVNTIANTPTAPIDFVIDDLETPGSLVMSGSSANQALVPNANIVFGGSGGTGNVTIASAPGQSGTVPITITVSDGTNTAFTTFPLMVTESSDQLFNDSFNYPDGSVLTNSAFLWNNRSGTVGECQVTNGQLVITTSQTEDVAGALVGGPYARSNSTVLYASFKANFLSRPKNTPEYFAHFANGSTLRGRIYASISNAPVDGLRLHVANGSDTTTPLNQNLLTNTVYTLVTRYDLDAATTTLWINPSSEADASVTATDAQSAVSISSYNFRQDSGLGATVLVDDIKAGLTFASVLQGTNTSVTPIPLQMQKIGNNLVLSWSNPAFGLQSAAAVNGPWTSIAGSSPHTNAITGARQFFRLIYP